MKIIVNGAAGRMGQTLCNIIENSEKHSVAAYCSLEYEGGSEALHFADITAFDGDADCIIDFSSHKATKQITDYAIKRNLPLVIATTGQDESEMNIIKETSAKIPLFYSQNMSFGVALLNCLAKIAAKALPDADIEIIEKHHNRKLDVPSGTALLLANGIKSVKEGVEYNIGRHENGKRQKKEIGIHSIRMGNEVGTHEIIFALDSQVITLTHEAENRGLFAEGSLTAASFLVGKSAGFYNMDDILE